MKSPRIRSHLGSKYSTKQTISFLVLSLQVVPLLMFFQNCSPGFKLSEQAVLSSLSVSSLSVNADVPSLMNTAAFTLNFDVTAEPANNLKSVSCVIDDLEPVDCTNGQLSVQGLVDGDHLLEIIPRDNANSEQPKFRYKFRVDQTAPTASLVDFPAPLVGSTSARITYDADDAVSGVAKTQCSFDGSGFADCTGAFVRDNLAAGTHSFKVRSIDLAGNVSEEKSVSWTIDTSLPSVRFTLQPNQFEASTTGVTYAFDGSDDGQPITTFECSLDNAAFSPCASPRATGALGEGLHTLRVRSIDRVGNKSAAISGSVTIDLTPPSAPVISTAVVSPTQAVSASFSLSAIDVTSGVALYLCSLDEAEFTSCASIAGYSGLKVGPHSFRAKSADKAGNQSGIETFKFNVIPVFAGRQFISDCQTDRVNPAITFRIYNDFDKDIVRHGVVYYFDRSTASKCAKPGWLWLESPTYKLGDIVPNTGNGVSIDLNTNYLGVTPLSDDVANSFSRDRACGQNFWSTEFARGFMSSDYASSGGSQGVCGYYRSLKALNGIFGNVLKVGDYAGVADADIPATRPGRLREDIPMYESRSCLLDNADDSRIVPREPNAEAACEPIRCKLGFEIQNRACVPITQLTSQSPDVVPVYQYYHRAGARHYYSTNANDPAYASFENQGLAFRGFKSGIDNLNYNIKSCAINGEHLWFSANCPPSTTITSYLNAYVHHRTSFNGTALRQLYWCRPPGTAGMMTFDQAQCAGSDATVPNGFAF